MYLGWAYIGNRLLSATVECSQYDRFIDYTTRCTYNVSAAQIELSYKVGTTTTTTVTPVPLKAPANSEVWVKTAEVLARDRLLGSFQVKPVLSRLKNLPVALAISLCLCAGLLIDYEDNQKELRKSSNTGGQERVVAGVYSDASVRSFEPDAFCG